MTALFANPYTRLAGRALVAGVTSALAQLHGGNTSVAWHAAIVAGALAFCEVFTPLNSVVGVFKKTKPSHYVKHH